MCLIFVHITSADRRTACVPKFLGRFREDSAERAHGLQVPYRQMTRCKNDDGWRHLLGTFEENFGQRTGARRQ